MAAAVWFIGLLVMFLGSSLWVGIQDMTWMGPMASDTPMFEIFKLFGVTSIVGQTEHTTLEVLNFPAAIWGIIRGLWWDYAILVYGGTFAQMVRVFLICVSAGMILSFVIMMKTILFGGSTQ